MSTQPLDDVMMTSGHTGVLNETDHRVDKSPRGDGQRNAGGGARKGNDLPVYRTRWGVWSILVASWCASLTAVIMRGGAVEFFITAVLTMIILLSALSPLLAAKGLAASRVVATRQVRDGGKASIRLTISRSRAIPFVWLAVCDEMLNTSYLAKNRLEYRFIAAPLFRKELHIDYTALNVSRGQHQFGSVTVTVGDWLGLTAIKQVIACSGQLLVLPGLPEPGTTRLDTEGGSVADLTDQEPGKPITAQQSDVGDIGLDPAARSHSGIGPESSPYREGDSLRHINWRVAAKGRGLHTKRHSLEQPVELVVLVDTAMPGYEGDERLFDACAGWAAQAIERAIARGGHVRMVAAQTTGRHDGTLNESSGEKGKDKGKGKGRASNGKHSGAVKAAPIENEKYRASNRQQGARLIEHIARFQLTSASIHLESVRQELSGMQRGGVLRCFTADWRNGQGWGVLSAYAAERGCRMELYVVTKQAVLSFAMREQQRFLEGCGVRLIWLGFPVQMSQSPQMVEGGDEYVRN